MLLPPRSYVRHVIIQPCSRTQHVVVQPRSSSLVGVVPVVMAWYLLSPARVTVDAPGLGLLDASIPRVQLEDILAGAAVLGLV